MDQKKRQKKLAKKKSKRKAALSSKRKKISLYDSMSRSKAIVMAKNSPIGN